MCTRWLVVLSFVLVSLASLSSARAQESCSADARSSCEQECQQGRAVACHLHGEELERRAESGDAVPEGGERVVDTTLLQEARTAYELACEGEFTWSCYRLADMDRGRRWHWRQKGLRVDRRLCAREEEAWACTRLALVYKEGKVVRRNLQRATALFERACEGGEAPACAHLGVLLLESSRKAPAKINRGIQLLEEACKGGLAWSCIRLGSAYRQGQIVGEDLDAAERLLRASCALGHQEGCVLLGVLLDQEQRAGKSKEAFKLFERACEDDVQSGCVNLGDLYEAGRGTPVDLQRAAGLFEAACNRYVGGCVRIGRMYDQARGVKEDPVRARGYFETGCQNQDDNACFHLALSLKDGRGGSANPLEASNRLRRQCQQGRALSCQILADMYDGQGLAKNSALRRRWLRKSCQLGRQQACAP